MKSPTSLLAGATLALLVVAPSASAETLVTTYASDNGNAGVMFDVLALKNIEITGVRTSIDAPFSATIDVFTRPGTFVGSEAVPAAWSLSGSALVSSTSDSEPTSIVPIAPALPINAGARVGIYLRRDAGANTINYTNGDGVGTTEAIDSALAIFEGSGINGSFGGINTDRIPNVTLIYDFQAGEAPKVRALSPRTLRTSDPRASVFALATDDGRVASVRARFRIYRPNGSARSVTRTLTPDTNGIVRLNLRTFSQPVPITFTAVDNKGQLSPVARVTIIGPGA